MGAQANCDEVRAAYAWENTQINLWVTSMTAPPAASGTIGPKFKQIWEKYFEEVKASNDKAISILNVANDNQGKKAIREFNRKYLPRRPLEKLGAAVDDESGRSDYFDSLSAALDLEIEAGDATRAILNRP